MKQLLQSVALAALVGLATPPAQAQPYPSKPVRIVVPSTAGDGSDVLARTLGHALARALGQSFVVENRPGAGGSIGADLVAKAAPDGYTVFLANGTTHGATPSLYPKLPYDSVKDFEPVVLISTAPNVLVVGPAVRAQTVAEFIALAKQQPGKITLASGGNGSISHLSIELLKSMAGINVLAAPTTREAEVLRTSSIVMAAQIRSGNAGPIVPPDEAVLENLDPRIGQLVESLQQVRAVGTPDEVVAGIDAFVAQHDLDEVITTTYTWDPALRRRSYELLAQAYGPLPQPTATVPTEAVA